MDEANATRATLTRMGEADGLLRRRGRSRVAFVLAAAAVACAVARTDDAAAQPAPAAPPGPAQPPGQPVPPEQPAPQPDLTKPVTEGALAPPRQPTGAEPEPPRGPQQPPLPIDSKRPEVDYDGREDEGPTAGEVLLWVPRIVFLPLYLVSEYVLRQPLRLLVTAAERGKWVKALTEAFTFGPSNNIGIVPTALLDFGFRVSVGVYMFYDDFLSRGNAFRVHAATGGADWLRLTVADRIPIDESSYFKLRFEASRRPDFLFHGIGPESKKDANATYAADWLDFSASFFGQVSEANSIDVYNAVRAVEFDPTCCDGEVDEPTVSQRVAQGAYALPSGFEGYTSYRQGIRVALDSRNPRPAPGTGVRLDVGGEHAFDLQRPGSSRWLRYGATLGGFLDIWKERVISLSATASFADPLDEQEVPFTELVQLGGAEAMRGFRAGRLMGRSAAVATFEYRWPIWALFDGAATASVGNVFGAHLDGFDPELLRASFTVGIRSVGARDHSFDVLVGAGTETFKDGAELNSLRLVIGTTRHF